MTLSKFSRCGQYTFIHQHVPHDQAFGNSGERKLPLLQKPQIRTVLSGGLAST